MSDRIAPNIKMNKNISTSILTMIAFPVVFLLVTIPSLLYGLSAWILIPIGLISRHFMPRPTRTKEILITLKFTTIFLLLIVPIILYLYVWPPLGWIFFSWMALYFLSRFYSGAHTKELLIREGAKKLESLEERGKRTYVKNNLLVSLVIVILSAISLVVGYQLGGTRGLWIGAGISIVVLLISPLKEATVEKPQSEE